MWSEAKFVYKAINRIHYILRFFEISTHFCISKDPPYITVRLKDNHKRLTGNKVSAAIKTEALNISL